MAQPSMAELQKQISKLQQQMNAVTTGFEQLSSRFALYWVADRKPPAFAIVMRKWVNKEGEQLADLLVISEHLSAIDLRFNKPLVPEDPEHPKFGCWEPMVLPLNVLEKLAQDKAKKAASKKSAVPEAEEETEEEDGEPANDGSAAASLFAGS